MMTENYEEKRKNFLNPTKHHKEMAMVISKPRNEKAVETAIRDVMGCKHDHSKRKEY